MEGNCRVPALAADVGCGCEFTRSNSDAMADAAENREEFFPPPDYGISGDASEWTDEKHNSYLHCLEVSFVEQLHQSKSMIASCSNQKQRGISISQKKLINAGNSSQQFNVLWNCCWHKINDASVMKYGRRKIYYRLETSSDKVAPVGPSHECLHDSTTEGMGQNFLDGGNQMFSDLESRAKRFKMALADSSIQDQIAPLKNCPEAKYSVINTTSLREELAHHGSV